MSFECSSGSRDLPWKQEEPKCYGSKVPGCCGSGKIILLAMNWCLKSWVKQSGTFAFDGKGA